jgi:hypothetical protein
VKTDHKIPVLAVSVSIKTHITRRVANAAFSNVIRETAVKKEKKEEGKIKRKTIHTQYPKKVFISFTGCCGNVLQKY